ncbi:Acetylcholinesterase [Lasiodiplodia theobromae]|uniref:Carboxylic ester hydrolase n=1 Tax=Lasiodiplodia theobromae TaxID=45133 RepID=A0A5N5DBL2_9PEZI|nr:Acetylcholinesterase [Lasiodiplodia theobromae]
MRSLAGLFLAQSLAAALPSAHTRVANSDLLVDTNLFKVQGKLADNTTTVRFFGGIPYAEPPVGTARFRSPVTKQPETDVIDATKFGPSCIQLDTGTETVYTEYLPGFLLTPGQTQSEDCLSLNIWAPRALNASSELLPVMIWIHGGGFTGGGSASPYKYGTNIVRDHQDVIVVALNYRITIFGFPNAAALNGEHLNPGLEDQRKAVEWVSENIRAFGGDPDRMILFGQSAGGMSVDKYAYAYPTDPLVSGFIAQSGLADSGLTKIDAAGTNFTYVAEQIGCSTTTASDDEVLACMQQADAADIIAVLNTYNATANGGRALSFTPAADGLTNFADYEERQEQGLFAHVPTLIAQVDNEGATLVSLPEGDAAPNQSAVDAITRNLATCPGARGAAARVKAGVPVWRARYFGEWPNLNPLEWLGAYHSSDIPMVFGTSDLLGSNTALEKQTSKYMQGAWVAFAKDPENGLKDQYAWPTYEAETESLVQLGYEGNAGAVFAKGDAFDESC